MVRLLAAWRQLLPGLGPGQEPLVVQLPRQQRLEMEAVCFDQEIFHLVKMLIFRRRFQLFSLFSCRPLCCSIRRSEFFLIATSSF